MKVYLIQNDDNKYKIGYTDRDVNKRIQELQTSSPYKLEVVQEFETNNATKIERMMHRKHASKRISGEWFDLSEEDVLRFKMDCQKIEDNLKFIEDNQILTDEIKKRIS